MSLFKDGKRASEPQPLPESMHGQVLYPAVTYRHVTLQMNFGPEVGCQLPFKCRMLADAATEDVEIEAIADPSHKPEVVIPVGLPDQGYFDWVDGFIEEHPDFVELSDRKIRDWALKSGFKVMKGSGSSMDRPDLTFNGASLADRSVQKLTMSVAPVVKRNYIVPELRAGLIASERKSLLANFSSTKFSKRAVVIMGEPNEKHKVRVRSLILAKKQKLADAAASRKKA